MIRSKKIFIGYSEVANFIQSYKKGFEALGYSTYTLVGKKNKYYPDAKYDAVMEDLIQTASFWPPMIKNVIKSFKVRFNNSVIFIKALFTCDIFYYNTGGHLLPFYLDYKLIKFFNKKLVVLYLGSEIRHWYPYKQEMKLLGYDELFATCIETYKQQRYGSFKDKLLNIKAGERYADLILSQPGLAQLQRRPYLKVTVGLYLSEYLANIPSREVPLIVHAPSSRGIKGTEFVIEALGKLNAEGIKFEFRLIENMTNSELMKLLNEADIVIDELNSDTIGVLSTEAMATGNAVLTGYIADYVKIPLPCPVLNTNRTNIYENIKKLIVDIPLREQLAKDGVEYVAIHHDIKKVVARDLEFLYSTDEKVYDFVPSFYKTCTIPKEIIEGE